MRKERTGFQSQPNRKGTAADRVNRLRFRLAVRRAIQENPKRGAPIAKHFHPKFAEDGVYMLSVPAFGIDARTLFVVRAGALYGFAAVPLEEPLALARLLRDPRAQIKHLA